MTRDDMTSEEREEWRVMDATRGAAEVGPRHGPLLPAIVHPGPRDALVLVDPGTGEELHLPAEATRALLDAIRSTGTLFPATREIPGFIDRALHG